VTTRLGLRLRRRLDDQLSPLGGAFLEDAIAVLTAIVGVRASSPREVH
jgi:hypothetical protein